MFFDKMASFGKILTYIMMAAIIVEEIIYNRMGVIVYFVIVAIGILEIVFSGVITKFSMWGYKIWGLGIMKLTKKEYWEQYFRTKQSCVEAGTVTIIVGVILIFIYAFRM